MPEKYRGRHQRKERESERAREKGIFVGKRTVKVEVKGKAITTSFLKIEGMGPFVGVK